MVITDGKGNGRAVSSSLKELEDIDLNVPEPDNVAIERNIAEYMTEAGYFGRDDSDLLLDGPHLFLAASDDGYFPAYSYKLLVGEGTPTGLTVYVNAEDFSVLGYDDGISYFESAECTTDGGTAFSGVHCDRDDPDEEAVYNDVYDSDYYEAFDRDSGIYLHNQHLQELSNGKKLVVSGVQPEQRFR